MYTLYRNSASCIVSVFSFAPTFAPTFALRLPTAGLLSDAKVIAYSGTTNNGKWQITLKSQRQKGDKA